MLEVTTIREADVFFSWQPVNGRLLLFLRQAGPPVQTLPFSGFQPGAMTKTDREKQPLPASPDADKLERLARLAGGVERELVADHLARLEEEYQKRYSEETVAAHLGALARLGPACGCRLLARKLDQETWELTVVAFDHQGLFSIIAGTLASLGLSIERGEVWTYAGLEPPTEMGKPVYRYDFRLRRYVPKGPLKAAGPDENILLQRKKIVDVFTIRALAKTPEWTEVEDRLNGMVLLLLEGKSAEARKKVGQRVVEFLSHTGQTSGEYLLPVKVKVDNALSERYTVMDIEAEDTPAFLYLFTNALAMRGVDIHSIRILTKQGKVRDRFFITDSQGAKISGEARIDELKFIVVLVKQFSHLLVRSPDPTMALDNFEKLVLGIWADREKAAGRGWKMLDLSDQPVMEALARLFGTSNFLWEDFLRLQYENLLPVFEDLEALEHYKDKAEMWSECELELLKAKSFEEGVEQLNRFKDREMFRTDMRHILDKIDNFSEFSRELSDLVEVVIEQAYRIGDSHLRSRYGDPLCEDGSPCRFAVFALGKAGGRELGYASDIELLFVSSGNGMTNGAEKVSTGVYYEKLVQNIIHSIRTKRRGIFEIDLRFRPFGNQGPLCNTLKQMEEYYSASGQAWDFERQCLVRLRPVAGDPELGRSVVELRDRFVYSGRPLNFPELHRLRRRQQEEFVKPGTWNAKFSEGGLVDIEYHVQYLQIQHGAQDPAVRGTATREALRALRRGGYISEEEFVGLLEAHDFLRRLINALRILRGHARDLEIPERKSDGFLFLARRMGYPPGGESRLAEDLAHHRAEVIRLVGSAERTGQPGENERNKSGE